MNIIIKGKVENVLTDEEKAVLIKILRDYQLTPEEYKIKHRLRRFIY